jgi:F-type H+-transporting ATPase subunit delta
LSAQYGQDIQLNVTVDPAVVGGMRVQIGAEVVDTTILTRLTDARRRLAS